MSIKTYLLIFLLSSFLSSFSQVEKVDSIKKDDNPYYYLAVDTNYKDTNEVYKPVLGFGRGIITFFGDVKDNYHSNPLVGNPAWIATISRNINQYFKLNFQVTYGKFSANEHSVSRNLNFQSQILAGSFNIDYNFKHLIKKPTKLLPYISLGFETFEFNSKTDLLDKNGYQYNYWSDGTIRNLPQTPSNETKSILIQRDYNYETDLREQNNDGLGKYAEIAFAIPIDLGVQFIYSNRLSMRLGATYHFTLNDNVDDISSHGKGVRKGNKRGDSFLVTYVSLHYDLFSAPKLTPIQKHFDDVDFIFLETDDEDGDGVIDLWDESPATPKGITVDNKGRPIDDDNDGFADYVDKEVHSRKNANVDLDGVEFTEEKMVALSQTREAVESSKMCLYYASKCDDYDGNKKFKKGFTELPAKFKPIDFNNDNYISIDELNTAIDKFFDFSTNFTIEDIYELNDFFFDQ